MLKDYPWHPSRGYPRFEGTPLIYSCSTINLRYTYFTNMKYTKGPWIIEEEDGSRYSHTIKPPNDDGWKVVAQIFAWSGSIEEDNGNALLVSLAPTMYELLKNLRELCLDENEIRRSDLADEITRLIGT